MPVHDDLGKRMKEFYEGIPKTRLTRRIPVAIRIDGKAFHTFTKGFNRPFDDVLIKTMQETTKYLCENIQGCVLGYTQSDEITLILVDYKKFTSSAWFDYEVQKMCSISASMATMAFNKYLSYYIDELISNSFDEEETDFILENNEYFMTLLDSLNKGAMFDARCFNIPKEEVTNLIYWRQLDATRNSIQMVGQSYFSHNQLHKKTCSNIQDMLMEEKGINWNDYPIYQKRGSCVIKEEYAVNENGEEVEIDYITDVDEPTEDVTFRTRWIIDKKIPIFKGEGREYIERLINF